MHRATLALLSGLGKKVSPAPLTFNKNRKLVSQRLGLTHGHFPFLPLNLKSRRGIAIIMPVCI